MANKKRGDGRLPYIPTPMGPQDADSYTYVDGRGFAPSPPIITERRRLQWCANGIGFSLLFYLFFSYSLPQLFADLVGSFVPALMDGLELSPLGVQLVRLCSGSLSLLLPFLLLVLIRQDSLEELLPFRLFWASITVPSLFIGLGVSVIGFAASTLLSGLLGLFGLTPVMASMELPQDPGAALVFLFYVSILAPLVEEIVFRGIIMGSLRRFGDCFALLLSALLFAAVHINLAQAPNAFLMGLVMGYFTLCTGSLWTGVLIHMLNNSLVILLQGLLNVCQPQLQLPLILGVYCLYLLLGIAATLYLLRQFPSLFSFHRSNTLSTERKKYGAFYSSLSMVVCLVLLVALTLSNLAPLGA